MSAGLTLENFARGLSLPPDEVEEALTVQRRSLPWYAEAVAAVGGWIAAIFLAVALGVLFGRNEAGLGIFGLMLAGGGIAALRKFSGPFGHQFALALTFAGQGCLVAAVGIASRSSAAVTNIAVTTAVIALVTIPLAADRLHQFVTIAAAVGTVLVAMLVEDVPYATTIVALVTVPAAVGLMLYPTRPLDTRPMAFVLLLAAPLCDAFAILESEVHLRLHTGWGGGLAYLIGIGWSMTLMWPAASRPGRLLMAGAAAAAVVAALLLPTGLVAGLMILVLAYAAGSRLLGGLGVVLEAYFMSQAYYDLRLDLMSKSLVLAVVGLVLLGLWFAWRRLLAEEARP